MPNEFHEDRAEDIGEAFEDAAEGYDPAEDAETLDCGEDGIRSPRGFHAEWLALMDEWADNF